MSSTVERIESIEFSYSVPDVGTDQNGFNLRYSPGNTLERKTFAFEIHTAVGITGEYVGGTSPGPHRSICSRIN
jgi:hypothetical protein